MVESPGSPAADTPAALEFALLEAWLASTRALQLPLHEIESQQQTKGREVQRLLLQAHLERRGDGDVGPALRVPQQAGTVLYTHRRLRTRSLKTIFGPVEINRMGYSREGAPSIIHSTRPSPYPRVRSPTNCSGVWSRGGAEPLSRIGRGHRRPHRRFCPQAQPGRSSAGCGSGL